MKMNQIEDKFIILVIFSVATIFLLSRYDRNGLRYTHAHSLPVTETPVSNSIIKRNTPVPTQITIDSSERPDPNVSTIHVLNSHNERVDNGNFIIVGECCSRIKTYTLFKFILFSTYT